MGRNFGKISFYLVAICLLGAVTQTAHALTFGSSGMDGSSGRNGYSGDAGDDVTIWAQELKQEAVYHLDGENGGDGELGGMGYDATSCFQRLENYNMRGASGGDGGRGGNGGDGGRGGDALIYYRHLSDLKKIYISSSGGYGGRGSWGGSAGRGCPCSQYSWSIPRCREVIDSSGYKHTVCDSADHYYCENGSAGTPGSAGREGDNGRDGMVTLIQADRELPYERLNTKVDFQSLNKGSVHEETLTENIFIRKHGILSYLAPGSRVSDYYYSFFRRASEDVRIEWKAANTPAPFKGSFSARISSGNVEFNKHTEDIVFTTQSIQNGVHVLTVTEAYNASQFGILGINAEGKRRSLLLRIKGAVPRMDMISDKVHLKIERKRFLIGYKTEFDGWVPADLLQYQGKDLIAKIGQLKFGGDDDTFKSDVELRLQVRVERRIEGQSKTISREVKLSVSQ